MKLSKNALVVLEKRYLRKNESGKVIETPEQMFRRVAENIAQAEKNYGKSEKEIKEIAEKFYEAMISLKFLPNSPTLMNAGLPLQQLSACFVVPIEDDMRSIFDAVKHAALIHQSGGGTGFSFSRLRPAGDFVKSTGGVASGPVSFMKVINAATEVIKQGGKRRGANMGILRIDHPDIEQFITCKQDDKSLTNFNISVAITDEFMKALEKDGEIELINPRTKKPVRKIKAKKLFDMIVEGAWRNGEPGVVFIDKINAANPTPEIGQIESTNPCGEQPLLPYESCNLGSINLEKFVKNGEIDWEALREIVRLGVRFLDNVIDMNKFPLPEIEKMTKANRKIGLGVMGWAHMLLHLGIPYNSEKALKLAEKVMKFIHDVGVETSVELAKERGSFPNFKKSIFPKKGFKEMRNATITTIAPTGTISMIADTSSGIEPIFSLVYVKRALDKEKLLYINRIFEEVAKERGFYSEKLMEKIAETGSIQNLKEIPEDIRKIFVTALDISPEWHIRMQAAFQKYTDNAVSKTINMPNSATKEDVRKAYLLAYKLGCKGITVYREGSRSEQVIEFRKEKKGVALEKKRARKPIMIGATSRIKTGCGDLYVTINEDENGPFELFARLGKSGGCASAQLEAIGRLVSLALRWGIPPEEVIKQLKNIRCPAPAWGPEGLVLSCADGIAKVFSIYMKAKEKRKSLPGEIVSPVLTLSEFMDLPKNNPPKHKKGNVLGVCPDCSGPLIAGEGCATCPICGFSKCA